MGMDVEHLHIAGSDNGWKTVSVPRNMINLLMQPFIDMVFSQSETHWIVTTLSEWRNANPNSVTIYS